MNTTKIYKYRTVKGPYTLHVTPGAEHPENLEWLDSKTKKPVMFHVTFINGEAVVPCPLARYLVDKGYAQSSAIMTLQPQIALPPKRKYSKRSTQYVAA